MVLLLSLYSNTRSSSALSLSLSLSGGLTVCQAVCQQAFHFNMGHVISALCPGVSLLAAAFSQLLRGRCSGLTFYLLSPVFTINRVVDAL